MTDIKTRSSKNLLQKNRGYEMNPEEKDEELEIVKDW